MIYIKKFDYMGLVAGQRKKAETANGRELLRTAVQTECGINTDTLTIEKGKYGKPYFSELKDIYFNISHSGEFVAAALGSSEVGVDIQTVRSVRDGLIEKLCDERERQFVQSSSDRDKAFITLWTLKESYIKAIGKGLSFPMNEVNFNLDGFCGEAQGKLSNREGSFFVKDFGEYVLAVCFLDEKDIDFSIVKL